MSRHGTLSNLYLVRCAVPAALKGEGVVPCCEQAIFGLFQRGVPTIYAMLRKNDFAAASGQFTRFQR